MLSQFEEDILKRHLRSCRCHDDAVDLELSRPLTSLLLQVHLGDVVFGERNLKLRLF